MSQRQSRQIGAERLQKILARAGFGSRRACEEFIIEGRVSINDQTVTQLGVKADPFRDTISVDGERLRLPKPVYYIINKPEGVFFSDKPKDASLEDFIKGDAGRLFSAGRLDQFSRGLMVVTNDGRVANVLTHPRYKVPKVFTVTVKGNLQPRNVKNIERALYYAMNNGRFEPLVLLKHTATRSTFRLTVYEGLPQSLKDICLKFGHGIKAIERSRVGIAELAGLKPGGSRKLRKPEVDALMQYVDQADAGKLGYENELLTPASFERDTESSNFRRKPKGTQSKSVGQRKTRTRVQGKTGDRKPSSRRTGTGKPSDRKPAARRASGGKPTGDRKPSSRRTGTGKPSDRKPAARRASSGKPSGDRKPSGRKPSSAKLTGNRSSSGGRKPSGGRASSGSRSPSGGKPSGSRSSSGGRKPASGRKPSGGRGRPSGGRRPGGRK
ncbi:MAG: pseudouridine synthase [Planctomycetota bacterium]